MTTDRELIQQALDALEGYARNCRCEGGGAPCDAAEALRARLEKWTVKDMAYRPNGLPQSEQELVAWSRNLSDGQPDLAAVGEVGIWGEREWQGLTNDEVNELSQLMVKEDKSVNWLTYAIEAKLKEKNAL